MTGGMILWDLGGNVNPDQLITARQYRKEHKEHHGPLSR